jgi:hypothetical protein
LIIYIDDEITLPSHRHPITNEKKTSKEQDILKQMDEKYKKKKVMNKNRIHNDHSKGLKFANQSQSNHSSVYE